MKISGYLDGYYSFDQLDSEIRSVVKIFTSIVKTTQETNPKLKTPIEK